MLTIKITEFLGYQQEDIYEYLLIQGGTSFCVVLERDDEEISFHAETIAREFFHAIYLGERLWQIATSFSYMVPAAYSTQDFEFEFETADLQALALILFEMVKAIEGPTEMAKPYWDKLLAFVEGYNNEDIKPVCVGLICVFDELCSNVNSGRGIRL